MKTLSLLIPILLLASTTQAATINGSVSAEGQLRAGMTVAAYSPDGILQASRLTSASGTYTLTLSAGAYRMLAYDGSGTFATSFHADADSFESSVVVQLAASQNVTALNFTLVRAGFATGRITTGTAEPLSGITVAAYNSSGTRRGFTTSDADGRFRIGLPPGAFILAAYDESLRYATTFHAGVASFDRATAVVITASQSITSDFILPLAAKIAGTVTARETGAPLPAMRVSVYGSDDSRIARVTTGIDGTYALAVRSGEARIVVDDPAGIYATNYFPDADSFETEVSIQTVTAETTRVNPAMSRAGRLNGRIVASSNGSPLVGLVAVAYNSDGTVRARALADSSGVYSIVVPRGAYRIGAHDPALTYLTLFYPGVPDFETAQAISVSADQVVTALDFALTAGARVSGRVVSVAGLPLAGMTAAAYGPDGRQLTLSTTATDGTYSMLVPPSMVKLLAFDPAMGFATAYYGGARSFAAAEVVVLTAGQQFTADFAMSEAGRISGTVRSFLTNQPLPGIDVYVYDGSALVAQTVTNPAGTYRVALPPGTYVIAAADPRGLFKSGVHDHGASVVISAGDDAGPIDIALEPAARRRVVRR